MFNRPAFLIVGLLIAAVAGFGAPVRAETISFIRDAEIESTIRNYSTPLFEAVGLDAAAVEVHLINSKRLNAFVAGGQKLFLNTGLLMAAESPNQVIGVIAHVLSARRSSPPTRANKSRPALLRRSTTRTADTHVVARSGVSVRGALVL